MRILVSVIMLYSVSVTSAQHLSFMGIQLGHDEKTFIQSIKAKGFKFHMNHFAVGNVYKGDFWKFMDCSLCYFKGYDFETGSHYIESVHIIASKQDVPEVSPALYRQLVNSFDSKYGRHHNVAEYMSKYSEGYMWIRPEGFIVTELDYKSIEGLTISIDYLDNSCPNAKEARERIKKREKKPARALKPRDFNSDL